MNTVCEPNSVSSTSNCQVQSGDSTNEEWNAMLCSLIGFKAKHGHCFVPNKYNESPQLGSWVALQRHQYNEMLRNKPTPMTAARAKLLESVGFVWTSLDSFTTPWEVRFEELKLYKQQYGNCHVPPEYEDGSLSDWVTKQKNLYRLKKEGKSFLLSNEKVLMLEELGFQTECNLNSPLFSFSGAKESAHEKSNVDIIDYASENLKSSINMNCKDTGSRLSFDTKGSSILSRRNLTDSDRLNMLLQQQAQNQEAQQILRNLAQIQCLEDAARRSLLQHSVVSNLVQPFSQTPLTSFNNMHPLSQGPHISAVPTNFVVGEDGQLIYNDSSINPVAAAAQAQLAGQYSLLKSQLSTHGGKHPPFQGLNSSDGMLPPFKGLNSPEACRLVTDEHVATSNDVPFTTIVPSVKSKRNREEVSKKGDGKALTSVRYPGPQTSDSFWWSRYEELKQFRNENGHCIVPNRYPPHPPLGNWVSTQRRQYKLWKSGKVSSMNEERAKALEEIGFSWVVRHAYNLSGVTKRTHEENEEVSDKRNSEVRDHKRTKVEEINVASGCFETQDEVFQNESSKTSTPDDDYFPLVEVRQNSTVKKQFIGGSLRENLLMTRARLDKNYDVMINENKLTTKNVVVESGAMPKRRYF